MDTEVFKKAFDRRYEEIVLERAKEAWKKQRPHKNHTQASVDGAISETMKARGISREEAIVELYPDA